MASLSAEKRRASSASKRTGTHAAPKPKQKRFDTAFLIIILILLAYGVIMVFSASYPAALQKTGNSLHFISQHVLYVAVGIAAMLLISRIDYRLYRRFAYIIFGIALILLILVAIPGVGRVLNNARRWIYIDPIGFQPSEIMKFAVIVLFSHLIAHYQSRMNTFKQGVLPFAAVLLVIAVLMMLEPHLSGTILIFGIGCIMMYIGGTKLRYFLAVGGLSVGAIAGIVAFKGVSYITERLQFWLNPFADINDKTWQTVQSLVAIGSGGLLGRGIGASRQKYLYLPEPYNDFIFAIICEELGLIGALFVIVLFVLFAVRGFSIASKAPDRFGFMLATGITVQICLQAALNIAVVTNTIPNTGISLPFFSYGGTAIMMQLGEMGILLNISRHAFMEKT